MSTSMSIDDLGTEQAVPVRLGSWNEPIEETIVFGIGRPCLHTHTAALLGLPTHCSGCPEQYAAVLMRHIPFYQ